jgi:cobalt-precorrin-5B (C1)-methyltransferase
MDVARAMGHDEIVLSAGRTSERAHMERYTLPEESYILMGDYLAFSLQEARKRGFKRIHLCAQWAKMLKIAMATPQTHVKFGAIDLKRAGDFLNSLGITLPYCQEFNTARQIFEFIKQSHTSPCSLFSMVCTEAKRYAEEISGGVPVITYLVSYNGEVIVISE